MQQKDKYNYSIKMGTARLKKQRIMLPIDGQGNPDYIFMEDYIKERKIQLIQKYKAFIRNNIQTERVLKPFPSLAWREFKALDLFKYIRGNQNNMNSLFAGDDMLISAKNANNGLKGFFVSNNDGDGGVGLAYYKPHKFLLDTHVYALYPIISINKYAMLFIAKSLSMQRVCFSHGYSISQDRLKKMKILLPVDETGNPDYSFMEQYGKTLMLQKYRQYLDYIGA